MAIQDEISKSRITLTYRTTINGAQETINLPFRLLVLGDFSLGSAVDRPKDLEERAPRTINGRNLDSVMADMQMSLQLTVPNRINPSKEESLQVTLPITKMRSFAPEEVAKHVPKVRALLLLKTLALFALAGFVVSRPWASGAGFIVGFTAVVFGIAAGGLWGADPPPADAADKKD